MRWVLYVDMDAFYLSCELKRHPELRGRPAAVAHDPAGGRGVVLSASYEARALGLHSAMPTSQALKLAPHVVYLPPDFAFYESCSRDVMALLRARSADSRALSIDEAALPFETDDPSRAEAEARAVQRSIREVTQLPCSLGVAPTLRLGKMASDQAKPGGVVVIPPEGVAAIIGPLPVRAVPGVGRVTEETLAAMDVAVISDLLDVPLSRLREKLGSFGAELRGLAEGSWSPEPWPEETGPRSLGSMMTFPKDEGDPATIKREVGRLAENLVESVSRQGYLGRTVTVRVRFEDFEQIQRSRTLPHRTESPTAIASLAQELLGEVLPGDRRRVRTLSVTLSDLKERKGRIPALESFEGTASPER